MATASIQAHRARQESEADAADRGATDKSTCGMGGGIAQNRPLSAPPRTVVPAALSRPGRHRQGACRVVVPGWLAQVGSGGAALGGRAGRGPTAAASWSTSAGRKPIRTAPRRTCATSKMDAPLRFASSATGSPCSGQGCARTAPPRCSGASTARAAGVDGRITGHSGRVGLAVELTRRGAPEQATAKAGGWKSSRMVAHYAAAVAAEQGAVATYL